MYAIRLQPRWNMIDLVSKTIVWLPCCFRVLQKQNKFGSFFCISFQTTSKKRFVCNQRLYGKNSLRGQTPAIAKPHRTTGGDQEGCSSSLFVNTTPLPKFSKSV